MARTFDWLLAGAFAEDLSRAMSQFAVAALDLVRYPQAGAGMDNVATVLAELGQKYRSE